ncbi:NACHT domain-containing protein [Stackebrandtia albiflava]|uniref:NACHT domain-containing protein n=1 Tax=Stackebrandtia albiflava TaxID=406432 RepID=A0A562VE72_9ACTN|nr:NACHT domain-containing protein [Stackebrandtia albiflava]TWJ16144.1 NACHT domain-containing protein [Stackebrandtia albiflava]
MSNLPVPPPNPASPSEVIATSLLALLALAPPGIIATQFWDAIAANPLESVLALAAYWAALAVLRFVGRVGGDVADRWVQRIADSADSVLSAALLGHRRTFVKRIRRHARELELHGLTTQGPFALWLPEVYVDVSLDPRATSVVAEGLHTRWEPGERRPLAHFIEGTDARVFTVAGYPGAGKTSLLRHAAATGARRGVLRRGRLPVLLTLRDHAEAVVDAEEPPDVADLVAGTAWLAGRVPAAWLRRRLERGNCLVLCDGLDETGDAEARRKVADWLTDQIARYEDNVYVVTSRPHGYDDNALRNTTRLHIRGFTSDQIAAFLHRWYHVSESRSTGETGQQVRARAHREAEALMERMRRRPALYDLASNPLLLTMIANVHRYRGALPGSRAELYREMCEMLLSRRRDEKGVGDSTLTIGQKGLLARRLAIMMMESRVKSLATPLALRVLSETLQRIPVEATAEECLADLVEGGTLIVRRDDLVAFPHLTFQEYLASTELADGPADDALSARIDDPWWRETILLWTEASDASTVVETCLRSGSVHALALAFECAKRPRELDPRLRAQLDDLLNGTPPTDDDGRALVAAVRISHDLHETVRLSGDVELCGRPVDDGLWRLFQADMSRDGRRPAADARPAADPLAPVHGAWAGDVRRFVAWVNSFFDDGTAYRLPTWAELADPAVRLVLDAATRPVWGTGPRGVDLFLAPGAADPFRIGADRWRDGVLADRRELGVFLMIALAYHRGVASDGEFTDRFDHTVNFTHAYGFAQAYDESDDTEPHVAAALSYVLARHRFLRPTSTDLWRRAADSDVGRVSETSLVRLLTRIGAVPERLGRAELLAIRAWLLLTARWLEQPDVAGAAEASDGFDDFLASTTTAEADHLHPDGVPAALRRAERIATAVARADPTDTMSPMAVRVIQEAAVLTDPFLRRRAGYDETAARCAGLGMYAAAAAMDRLTGTVPAESAARLAEAASSLRGAARALLVLRCRVAGEWTPADVVVLARS